MRVVLQRVTSARVLVDGQVVGAIGRGLVALVGIRKGDDAEVASRAAQKIAGLRLFADNAGAMNLDASQVGADFLVVSNFTLAGSLERGRRPSFDAAERPELAEPLIELFVEELRSKGFSVPTGRFRQEMSLEIINDGPVTFVYEA